MRNKTEASVKSKPDSRGLPKKRFWKNPPAGLKTGGLAPRRLAPKVSVDERVRAIRNDSSYEGQWVALSLTDLQVAAHGEEQDKVMKKARLKYMPSDLVCIWVDSPNAVESIF